MNGATLYAAGTVRELVAYGSSCYILIDVHHLQINYNLGNRTASNTTVPLRPNSSRWFVGREKILAILKDHFTHDESDIERKYFLLYGMGGIGKTQIYLRFIELMSN